MDNIFSFSFNVFLSIKIINKIEFILKKHRVSPSFKERDILEYYEKLMSFTQEECQ